MERRQRDFSQYFPKSFVYLVRLRRIDVVNEPMDFVERNFDVQLCVGKDASKRGLASLAFPHLLRGFSGTLANVESADPCGLKGTAILML